MIRHRTEFLRLVDLNEFPMRLRLTTRRSMLAVALVAVLCAHSAHYRGLAHYHEQQQRMLGLSDLELWLVLTAGGPGSILDSASEFRILEPAKAIHVFVSHHKDLEDKYRRAAIRPWLFVESDPPPAPEPSEEQMQSFRELIRQ